MKTLCSPISLAKKGLPIFTSMLYWGTESRSDFTACNKCTVGTFAGVGDPLGCQACPAGTFSENEGSEACTLCPVGKYQSSQRQTSADDCIECPSNTFTTEEGSEVCTSCPGGSYTSDLGNTECIGSLFFLSYFISKSNLLNTILFMMPKYFDKTTKSGEKSVWQKSRIVRGHQNHFTMLTCHTN